ncbi:WG repeat-containing protein [Spirochaeta cellobiosiphila]|uniref:WG repeat-containing protein n=1 Tax=Spirochaeta cellobiosiphila TaxID=504483 RepID=UPI0004069A17|nr:WG repeat-containing protein [Spirochaeta cellobiosiphila]
MKNIILFLLTLTLLSCTVQYYPVKVDDTARIIDSRGREVDAREFDDIQPFDGKVFRVYQKNVWLLWQLGVGVISDEYDFIGSLKDSRAIVIKEGKYGYIDRTGQLVIPLLYTYGAPFSEGLALVRNTNGHTGYINVLGRTVIPFQYDEALPFNKGAALVTKDNKSLLINKKGDIIWP